MLYNIYISNFFNVFCMGVLGNMDFWLNFNSSLHLLVKIKGINYIHVYQTGS